MSDKDISVEELEETARQTDEQLDLMAWKMDSVDNKLVEPVNSQDMCIMNLLKSVSEVRSDYQQLRRELVEVQALQRELSSRLRSQLRLVHGKFARLRQRLAAASPPR
ncbi:unnamed protein product [Arctia plantaginis]|uniref:Ska2 N-terminal domain-containing protein n=1 Tax=Arctia plantaginis TaxID=874455 RepID=A0A8S1AHX4_ARCPL|nr:unnamed protein product [Arctia plantaginis]CAB3245580.1 unnamed protein product [Arctia plantaginis]